MDQADAEGAAAPRRRGLRLGGLAAGSFVLLVAAALAVGLVSADRGWLLTHPPVQPVQGDPANQAALEYRCLPVPMPEFCTAQPLFTPGQHIPIFAWILPAVPETPQGYPGSSGNWSDSTVVLVSDHGQSRTPSNFPVWTVSQLLVQAGYNVVLFDTRGTGQSGGSGIAFGTLEVRDLLTVVDYFHDLGGPPQGYIAVWGLGTGADTAILAAAQDPNIAAVIADSPYLTPGEYLRRAIPGWTGLPAFPFARTILWTMQWETGVGYGAYNPLAAAARLGGRDARPLLVVAGEADRLTPPADAQRLFQAAGPRAFEYPVPGAGHLQAYAKSAPDAAVSSLTTYDCLVLNTLKAMQAGTGNASPGGPFGPCGGYQVSTSTASPGGGL